MRIFFIKSRMYCVHKALYFFLLNKDFLTNKVFFINYFNVYNMIIINSSSFKKNHFEFSKKPKNVNNFFQKDTFFLTRYFYYFNKLVIFNNNIYRGLHVKELGSYKNKKIFYLNKYNFKFFKKLTNLIFQIKSENKNLLILDNNYRTTIPLYNYIFGLKNLLIYKDYFFINKLFFTYKNWMYLYISFLKKFKVILLVIIDFYHFRKFFKNLKILNLPISSLIPVTYLDNLIDYPIIISHYTNLEKFVFSNFIIQNLLISYNYKNYNYNLNYIRLFYNFYNSFKGA